MSTIGGQAGSKVPGRRLGVALSFWVRGAVVALCVVLSAAVQAEEADEQFVAIYNAIQQADSLAASNNPTAALKKYQSAERALQSLQRANPNWNRTVVAFRLDYLAQKITALSTNASSAAQGSASAAGQAAEGSTTQVKLLEPGAEPRQVLRLHPKPGDHQTLNLIMNVSMEVKAGQMETPAVKLPTMKMALEATVKNVGEDGEITYEMLTGDATVADEPGAIPQVVDALKAAFANFKGMSGTGRMSNRGFSKGVEMKVPSDANPQLRQFIDQMKESFSRFTAPLPEEAVGAGARWEAKLPVKEQGMALDQTTVYEVVSIEGDRVTTRSTVTQSAANQTIDNPAMPGMKAQLTRMTGQGKGQVSSDLTRILPLEGSAELHTELAMAMNMGSQKQAMTMKMDMKVRLDAK
jgi:hypothetical protein